MGLNGKSFILTFKKSRLGRSRLIKDSELTEVTPANADPDGYIYVLCDRCNKYMNYDSNREVWICPECGAKTKATSVYSKFSRECDDFEKAHQEFKI